MNKSSERRYLAKWSEQNAPAGCTTRTSMATLVRCIEGHEFESAVSETCPICGSAVSKKEPVVENKPPLGRTGAKKIAEDIVLFGCAVFVLSFFALTFGKNLPAGGVKSVVHDAWERITDKSVIHDTWERIMDPRSHYGRGSSKVYPETVTRR
jgi:hypothetical protein